MSLYDQWREYAEKQRTQAEYDEFWKTYFLAEKKNYEIILEKHNEIISGKLKDLAAEFEMEPHVFVGFLDGINTSLVESIDIENVDEDTDIKLEVDFEKLYYNMLDAKAEWLYNLEQWDDVLSKEKREQIKKEYRTSKIAVSNKVGRNEPCSCGSGKKYKKCCGANK